MQKCYTYVDTRITSWAPIFDFLEENVLGTVKNILLSEYQALDNSKIIENVKHFCLPYFQQVMLFEWINMEIVVV